jgi:hypothetical protein
MAKQRLKRWGTVTVEWILSTLQEIANNLGSLRCFGVTRRRANSVRDLPRPADAGRFGVFVLIGVTIVTAVRGVLSLRR